MVYFKYKRSDDLAIISNIRYQLLGQVNESPSFLGLLKAEMQNESVD
jgi:hypothetical protein